MSDDQGVMKKILEANSGTYVIFFVPECQYCQKALELLRQKGLSYKGYNIHDLANGMQQLLKILNDNKEKINFNSSHTTKPIIFLNKQFIGGLDNLQQHFIINQMQ